MRSFITIIFVLLSGTLGAYSQTALEFACTTKQPQSESDFKQWANKSVRHIITKDEKTAFLKLTTAADRNAFIERFWTKRDPNPDTAENEFQKEYCERIVETDQFESGIPGWMTDRGKIYIVWGKPDKIEKGYSTFKDNFNVPYEKWFYEYIAGCCGGVEITFIDPTETGEFRIFKPSKVNLDLVECSECGSL
ncbi:MAG: GWxTD domain-containing protein [Actinomycetota bacterium]